MQVMPPQTPNLKDAPGSRTFSRLPQVCRLSGAVVILREDFCLVPAALQTRLPSWRPEGVKETFIISCELDTFLQLKLCHEKGGNTLDVRGGAELKLQANGHPLRFCLRFIHR